MVVEAVVFSLKDMFVKATKPVVVALAVMVATRAATTVAKVCLD